MSGPFKIPAKNENRIVHLNYKITVVMLNIDGLPAFNFAGLNLGNKIDKYTGMHFHLDLLLVS